MQRIAKVGLRSIIIYELSRILRPECYFKKLHIIYFFFILFRSVYCFYSMSQSQSVVREKEHVCVCVLKVNIQNIILYNLLRTVSWTSLVYLPI